MKLSTFQFISLVCMSPIVCIAVVLALVVVIVLGVLDGAAKEAR